MSLPRPPSAASAARTPVASASGGLRTPVAAGAAATNVRVAVRVRPFNKRERGLDSKCIVEVEGGNTIKITDPGSAKDEEPKTYVFDHAYGWDSTQEQLFADVASPILESAMQGFNGTVFAYGQTGSGKSHSMLGDTEHPGIIPRLNAELFARLRASAARSSPSAAVDGSSDSAPTGTTTSDTDDPGASKPPSAMVVEHLVTVSYLEIYNEVVKDLLNPSDKQLVIREHPEMGVYVQDLAEIVVHTEAEVTALIEQGQRVRHVAATAMNERSSRSHSCFTIRVEQRTCETTADKKKTTTLSAKINLVDLAGSERASKTGATGDILKQGAAINKSLSALGNVINALAEGKRGHVPYRDSKLTRLLQHSLGGNSLTVMVAALSPADDNFDETLSTLQYANRAKNIKNVAKANEDVNETLIRQLRDEIEALRRALAAAQAGGGAGVGGEAMTEEQRVQMEEMVANLERAKQQSWAEKERLSQLFEAERQRNLENENRIRAVMQSLKDDNIELIKRMKRLVSEHTRQVKQYRALRRAHTDTKRSHEEATAYLNELQGGAGPAEDIAQVAKQVGELQLRVEAEARQLAGLRAALRANDEEQSEARAEAAAQKMMIEEDAELRKAIAEEERCKLEREANTVFEKRLDAERRRLLAAAAAERAALELKFAQEVGDVTCREHELQLAHVKLEAELAMARLDVEEAARRESAALERQREAFDARLREVKREELKMVHALVTGFEGEQGALQRKLHALKACLTGAVGDIELLRMENAELQRRLQQPGNRS